MDRLTYWKTNFEHQCQKLSHQNEDMVCYLTYSMIMYTLICVRDLQYPLNVYLSREKKWLRRKQRADAKVKTIYSFERLHFIRLLSNKQLMKNQPTTRKKIQCRSSLLEVHLTTTKKDIYSGVHFKIFIKLQIQRCITQYNLVLLTESIMQITTVKSL